MRRYLSAGVPRCNLPTGLSARAAFPPAAPKTIALRANFRQKGYPRNAAMPVHLQIELPSDPKLLAVVRGLVERWSTLAGFSEEDARQVMLAVDEAFTNIIRHAYANRTGERIQAEFSREEGVVTFLIEDSGLPVDRSRICRYPPDELRPGGRGTHFIRQIMSEVEYQTLPSRNRVRLVKYRPARATESKEGPS